MHYAICRILDNYKLNVQMDGFYIYNSLYTAQTIMDKEI